MRDRRKYQRLQTAGSGRRGEGSNGAVALAHAGWIPASALAMDGFPRPARRTLDSVARPRRSATRSVSIRPGQRLDYVSSQHHPRAQTPHPPSRLASTSHAPMWMNSSTPASRRAAACMATPAIDPRRCRRAQRGRRRRLRRRRLGSSRGPAIGRRSVAARSSTRRCAVPVAASMPPRRPRPARTGRGPRVEQGPRAAREDPRRAATCRCADLRGRGGARTGSGQADRPEGFGFGSQPRSSVVRERSASVALSCAAALSAAHERSDGARPEASAARRTMAGRLTVSTLGTSSTRSGKSVTPVIGSFRLAAAFMRAARRFPRRLLEIRRFGVPW